MFLDNDGIVNGGTDVFNNTTFQLGISEVSRTFCHLIRLLRRFLVFAD